MGLLPLSVSTTQQIEEQYTITVSAPNSIAAVGTLPDKMQGRLKGVYPQVVAAENSMTLYRNDVSGIPRWIWRPRPGLHDGGRRDADDRHQSAAAQNAMQTLIQVAKTRIAGSHRHNYVTASVPLNPSLDLPLTVDINVPGLHAVGKVRTVAHVLSPETGQAVTNFAGYFFRCRRRRHALRHAEHCASRHQSGKHRAYRVSDCGFQLRSIGRPHDHRDLPRRGVGRAKQGQSLRCPAVTTLVCPRTF